VAEASAALPDGATAEGAAPAGTRRGECGGTPEPLAGVGHTQNKATDLPAGLSFTIIKAEMGEGAKA
jgi:hypothetical protein